MITNLPLARSVYAKLENEPDSVDQGVWVERTACGTTACTAGWTCILAGYDFEWDAFEEHDEAHRVVGGRRVGEVAAELLGLNGDEKERLFLDARFVNEAQSYLAHLIAVAEAAA